MLSSFTVKLLSILPEELTLKLVKKKVNGYIKKYANLKVEGLEELKNEEGPFIFVCNHLSNSDGLVLDHILKERYDPIFVAGVKLSKDPITNFGIKIVRNILVKPNSADKEAISKMVKSVRNGDNILIFPEGTRSRTGAMIEGKKGIVLIARMAKAKIVPIGMSGTDKLLPISKSDDMGGESWGYSDVTVKFGKPITLRKKLKEEDRHEFEDECLENIMKSIANLLPESYRGVYK